MFSQHFMQHLHNKITSGGQCGIVGLVKNRDAGHLWYYTQNRFEVDNKSSFLQL